ncbi:sensor histidine kinase [Acanthopleuribacter pedis]|uniref:Histidine kinase n=1 Tax=Acanthopleuribacter pedis TaxID=442870 RepID=A0A8J7Q736_9BACT|nr:histidine kinase [Acanthopleuribacter pedis]MBO1319471.1 histidine kinase [Acanthopleuribacter pedis]
MSLTNTPHFKRLKIAAMFSVSLTLAAMVYGFQAIRLDPIPYGNGAMEILIAWGYLVNLLTFLYGYAVWVPRWLAHRSTPRFVWAFLWPGPAAVLVKLAMVAMVIYTYTLDMKMLGPLLGVLPPTYTIFAWGLVALGGGARFAEAWLEEQQLRRELEHQRTSAELAQLKRQVNPHFLFNTLNNLYALALREDAPQTAEAVMTLSTMMRTMVHEVDDEWVPLDRELNYLRAYIKLEQLRLPKDREHDITLTAPDDLAGIRVPPMMLMTLVENAFKHGISFKAPSPIQIALRMVAGRATLQVRNRIHPNKTQVEEAGGFGLSNLAERLAWYGPDAGSLTTTTNDGWFEATLVCPKEKTGEMHHH